MKASTLKGLNGVACWDAGDATLSGLIKFGEITQGSPALRANPGLSDGIPLGFENVSNSAGEFNGRFSPGLAESPFPGHKACRNSYQPAQCDIEYQLR